MENRFGFKDFFILLIVCILIVLVLVAMRQFDRQYDNVLTIKSQNEQLAADVMRIKRQISDLVANGVAAPAAPAAPQQGNVNSGTPTTRPAARVDAFSHLRDAEKLPGFA